MYLHSLPVIGRVIYVSATGASELKHMCYMDRLGLWGEGTAFATMGHFESQVKEKGVGGMEMVAMDLKGRGIFLSRTLSYKGASFEVNEVSLNAEFKQLYNECCDLWGDLFTVRTPPYVFYCWRLR